MFFFLKYLVYSYISFFIILLINDYSEMITSGPDRVLDVQ